jgi:succinylglutamate desuccinylase
MLRELHHIPDGLLMAEARQLERLLGAPTLLHLPGRREPALFVSVLMHGNETVGWEALRGLLLDYGVAAGAPLPRALSVFIGNVAAAARELRRLDGQPDYNRVWPGSEEPPSAEHQMMRQVVAIMAARGLFASVDVHNNTGINPHYACVNALDNRYLQLATLFSRTVVYFLRPKGVQSMAMARLAPAVTLECGKVGQAYGVRHAREYLDACLHLAEHPQQPVSEHDIDLFHTVAQVKIPPHIDFSVNGKLADVQFSPGLERFNFRELPSGAALARVRTGDPACLEVRDEQGRDVAGRYFNIDAGELRLRLPVMPSMLTLDERVIRQDCLCYLMERYSQHLPSGR